jgi:transposase
MLARRLLLDVYLRLQGLNEQILTYDRELEHLARASDAAQRLMTIPGIGAITATALLASAGDPTQFRNGRQFAAWLGLTPRQYTTGGKIRLGEITKKGDAYLRTLLIHGTRAVLATVNDKSDRLSIWIRALIDRRGYKRAAVALSAKNARIVRAIMLRCESYQVKSM